ncbi:hypothetical protein M6B38_124125 [Iris pallida]|uniref:Uncharacterized protein n=1 Tax=Iris pallida TaxID=29817 RepID=A0AAX6EP27_IRIPA|nr:hypothetical protein M6B38_111220 [Iris pallida]KAJ6793311.1 hypothetical protein M6B38_111225 [Iris pallida]KAJ6805824.1 hypothetical protein M6B38_178050 [Iris pallida]KAJ6805825.1 hypothetical protein M6B38_178055 [Iris pallida]KAJ6818726.1 hypothetical protein M6B38_131765 [Iris pallida]
MLSVGLDLTNPVVTLGLLGSLDLEWVCFWEVFLVHFCVDFWRWSDVLNPFFLGLRSGV